MSDNEPRKPSNEAGSEVDELFDDANTSDQERSTSYYKNGKQTASNSKRVTRGKNDPRYWWARIFKPVNGRGELSPHYSVKVQFHGRRCAFALSTGNKAAAARRAVTLYNDIVHRGLDAVLADRRAMFRKSDDDETPPPTIGAWIEAARQVFAGKPSTFGSYARALRFIASEILATQKDRKRFSQTHAEAYRRKIDAAPISILTPEAVQAWRIGRVAKSGDNPARQKAARITCNSTVRAAKALFSKRILKFTSGVGLPDPLPFAGVEFYARESMRYHSKIDPATLLRKASQELAETDSDAFLALILAIGAGLRRGEIDRLLWKQVDFRTRLIHVEVTEVGGLKSADSAGAVPFDESLSSVLQGFRARSRTEYVLEGGSSLTTGGKPWGRHYRCQNVFERLMLWLRKNGVESRAPIHVLRKEAGSLIATQSGIFAASRFLRHADMQVTAMHYATHKERVTVNMSALLSPANVIELEKSDDKSLSSSRKTSAT